MKMDYLCTVHNLTTTFYYGLVYLTDFCIRDSAMFCNVNHVLSYFSRTKSLNVMISLTESLSIWTLKKHFTNPKALYTAC